MHYTTNWCWNTCRWCTHRVTGTYQEEYRYPMIEKERVEELFYTPTMRTDKMSVSWRKKEICLWQFEPIAKSSAKSREMDSAAYLLHHILPPTCFYPDATPNLNHAAYFQLVYTHLTWKISVVCCMNRQTWGISRSDSLDIDWSSYVKVAIIIL